MTDSTERLEKLSERGQGLAEKYGERVRMVSCGDYSIGCAGYT